MKRRSFGVWFVCTLLVLLTLVACNPLQRNPILGLWQNADGLSQDMMEFLGDGTVLMRAPAMDLAGTYEMLEYNQISIATNGLFGLFGPQVYNYTIEDDVLVLTNDLGTGMYRRVSSEQGTTAATGASEPLSEVGFPVSAYKIIQREMSQRTNWRVVAAEKAENPEFMCISDTCPTEGWCAVTEKEVASVISNDWFIFTREEGNSRWETRHLLDRDASSVRGEASMVETSFVGSGCPWGPAWIE